MMPEIHVYSVAELNRTAKQLLEEALGTVWVRGEISNLSVSSSGHSYFTLVDGDSELSAVRFRSRLPLPEVTVRDGLEVMAYGRLTVYEPRGRYQLVVTTLQPAGLGAQQIAFEQLKAKLDKEGLFAPARKKPLPAVPRRVGVVTSPTGAAIRDIVSVLERRWPLMELVLFPTAVQGAGAGEEIAAAVRAATTLRVDGDPLDVLIITRGGGSAEDLAPFNDERLARTLFDCAIPVISAVGHEIDVTIADFVADRRAPTPSAAGELVAPDGVEILARATAVARGAAYRVRTSWQRAVERLDRRLESYVLRVPVRRVESMEQRFDQGLQSLRRALDGCWQKTTVALAAREQTVLLSDPHRPLARGYSLTFPAGSDTPLRDAAEVAPGSRIATRLWRGLLESTVEEVADVDR
jgi:exodeoxyribonuclease VII large subunit